MAALLVVGLCAAAFAAAFVPYASAQNSASVSIKNYAFSPGTITVVIGVNNTVTWTNMDSVTHTVTANDNSWGSGDLSPGATYSHTFTTAGTFSYHCSIHTYMTGTVVVMSGGSTSESATSTSVTSSSAVSTASATSSQASSATTTTTAGGVPEFPFQGVLVAAITLTVVASYFVLRQSRRGHGFPAPSPS